MKHRNSRWHKRQEEKPKTSGLQKIAWGIGIISGLFTIYLAVARITASTSLLCDLPLNPINPFSAPFIVKNEALACIKHIKWKVHQNRVETERGNVSMGNTVDYYRYAVPILCPGESHSVIFGRASDSVYYSVHPLVSADIVIIVSYDLWFWPKTMEDRFHFVTAKNSKGEFRWYKESLVEAVKNDSLALK